MSFGNRKIRWLILPLTGLTIGLGYFVEQSDFWPIIIQFGIFFLIYLAIFNLVRDAASVHFFLFAGILLRFLLLWGMPQLSDDVYRFIWDGRLLAQGINPFEHLPKYYLENNIAIPGISQELFDQLNSPEYFTIYPPLAQAVFAFACRVFPDSILGSTIVMKFFLFACEIGSLFYLKKLLLHFQLPLKNILLYALNPLIIIELCGNLHFEAVMICFLLMAIYFLVRNEQLVKSAFAMALAIVAKLLPLIFLPFLIRRLGWKKSVRYFMIIGLMLAVLFMPLLNTVFFENFAKSLDLYFQKFEFNGSIYYLVRWLGYQIVGYNWIQKAGPILGILVLISVILMVFLEKKLTWLSLFEKMFWAICIYFFLATIVHPWYVSLPVVLCIFTRFRFAILWSGLIYLTYINYSHPVYFEHLGVVSIEYIGVFAYLGYELFFKKNDNQLQKSRPLI